MLACEYNDDQELTRLTHVIEYMKKQIELENREVRMKEIQTALKEDGIEMSHNCTMDIVISSGSHIKHIFPLWAKNIKTKTLLTQQLIKHD